MKMSLETRAHPGESAARIDEALKANMQRKGFESQIVHLDRHRGGTASAAAPHNRKATRAQSTIDGERKPEGR